MKARQAADLWANSNRADRATTELFEIIRRWQKFLRCDRTERLVAVPISKTIVCQLFSHSLDWERKHTIFENSTNVVLSVIKAYWNVMLWSSVKYIWPSKRVSSQDMITSHPERFR